MSTQTVRNYVADATIYMENALRRMPIAAAARPLPYTLHEIARYVEQLLTPEEQAVYDMATD